MSTPETFGMTLKERPFSKDELLELLRGDEILASATWDGGRRFVVRNAHARREYEIRAAALRFYLNNVGWISSQ